MENMICNRREEINLLTPYINQPVYVKGYCWGRKFDGWTVIYDDSREHFLSTSSLAFDYRGGTYSVYGFLPSRYIMATDSSYNNAFYEPEL